MRRPHACRVLRANTRRRARTHCRARARWAASAAWLGTPIWMVQARRARYAGLASTQAWGRHRAYRVQRVDTTTTRRRRYRRPRVHRVCRAMWGTMHHRVPLCARTAHQDTTTTIGIRRHHVTVMRGNARQARTRELRRVGARLVRLVDTITTRTRRQRAMRVHRAHTRVLRRRHAQCVHQGRRTQTPTHPHLVWTVLWASTVVVGPRHAWTASWVRRMLTGHHRRLARHAQRGSMVREALRHA
jgi:hypothetical protein